MAPSTPITSIQQEQSAAMPNNQLEKTNTNPTILTNDPVHIVKSIESDDFRDSSEISSTAPSPANMQNSALDSSPKTVAVDLPSDDIASSKEVDDFLNSISDGDNVGQSPQDDHRDWAIPPDPPVQKSSNASATMHQPGQFMRTVDPARHATAPSDNLASAMDQAGPPSLSVNRRFDQPGLNISTSEQSMIPQTGMSTPQQPFKYGEPTRTTSNGSDQSSASFGTRGSTLMSAAISKSPNYYVGPVAEKVETPTFRQLNNNPARFRERENQATSANQNPIAVETPGQMQQNPFTTSAEPVFGQPQPLGLAGGNSLLQTPAAITSYAQHNLFGAQNASAQPTSVLPTPAQARAAENWDRFVMQYRHHDPPYAYGMHTSFTHNSADRQMVKKDTTNFSIHRIREVLPKFTEIFGSAEKARVVEWRKIQKVPSLVSGQDSQLQIRQYQCRTSQAIQILCEELPPHERSSRKVCALNFASAENIGGIWDRGSTQQEESLCMRSDLFQSLDLQKKAYPLREDILLYTDKVRFFAHEDLSLRKTDEFCESSIISIAAQQGPMLRGDDYLRPEERQRMMDQLCAIPRVAAYFGATHLVVGAFGCGVYRHPVNRVAEMMVSVLSEGGPTREDWFNAGIQEVIVAIHDHSHDAQTYNIFSDAWGNEDNVKVDLTGRLLRERFARCHG
jgi:uncharacterized protein (TIGR02452 family)